MSGTPPSLPKPFGRYDWAALLSMIAVPMVTFVVRGSAIVAYMFPDVPMVHAVTGEIDTDARHGFAYAGIAFGLFALTGLQHGGRVRICWMAGAGLLLAGFDIFLRLYFPGVKIHH